MAKRYMDWTDWAGDHHEQVEAERRAKLVEKCEHAEVSSAGYCENCGMPMMDWEPDDAQLLTQSGTKEPAA